MKFCGIPAPKSNFAVSAEATTVYNGFESYTFEIIAVSSRGQWVKYILMATQTN